MASDPSIYAQVGANTPAPYNALAGQAQVAQTANALMGVQQARSRQAAGQAFQASINPDGTTNQSALMQNLAANPAAAMSAQESAQAGQTLSNSEYAQHMTRLSYGASGAAQLLAQYPNGVPATALKSFYDQAVTDGHMTPEDEQQSLAPYGTDPNQNTAIIKQKLLQNVAAQSALTSALPAAGSVQQGNQIQPTSTSSPLGPNGNVVSPVGQAFGMGMSPQFVSTGGATVPTVNGQQIGPGITNTTGPETNAQLVDIPDPNHPGATLKVPRSSLPGANGQPIPTPNGLAPGAYRPRGYAPPASPATPSPVSATQPATPQATAPVAPAPQATAVPAGAIPGSADPNVLTQNSADVAAYQQAKASVPTAVTDTQTLGHALDALKVLQADSLGSGPGSDSAHRLYAYATTLGLATPGMQDNAAAYELAKKNLTRYAASQGTAAHTDMGLSTAAASNASVDSVGNQAAQTVVKQELGKRNQAIAQVNEVPNQTGIGYNAHASQFAQTTDPRAFAFDSYTPQERAQIIGMLKPGSPERAKFTNSLAIAQKYGMISPPSAAPAPAAQPTSP